MILFNALGRMFIRHAAIILLAIFFGALIVYPHIVAKFSYGIPFDSPSNNRIDDETLYFGRIQEVIDGYPTIGSPYLWEHKAKPPSPVFLGEYLSAQPIKLLDMGVVAGGVLYDAILPPILAILTYLCLFLISRRRDVAFLGSTFLLFGVAFTDFARLVSPQFNFLLWLTQFLLLYCLTTRELPRSKLIVLVSLAALNFGALFFIYTYYWTFFLAFLGIALFLFFATGERTLGFRYLSVIIGGLIVAIPYFLILRAALLLPEYTETLRRIGMIDSHFPSGIFIVGVGSTLLILIAISLYRRVIAWDNTTIFFLSGVLAAITSVNQHVLTGKNLEFSSHYHLLATFWFVFTVSWLFSKLIVAMPRIRKFAIVLGAVLVIALSVRAHSDVSVWFEPPLERINENQYVPVLSWLRDHASRDEVVYAPSNFSALIPVYTSANVFYTHLVRLAFLSDNEVLDRFVLNHYFKTFDRDFAVENITYIFGVGYIDEALHTVQENKVRRLIGLAEKPVERVPEDLIQRILDRGRELQNGSFIEELKKYRIDYILWDTLQDPGAPFETMSELTYLDAVGQYRIYKLH